jgi:hypothetical protein
MQEIFTFLTQQLKGLNDPESATFKRYFYLLEVSNGVFEKSFDIFQVVEIFLEKLGTLDNFFFW